MSKEKLADYIFSRITKAGVQHTFGIPGDFILPFYAAQTRTSLKTVVMTHEPSVGYAADAYARLRGLGVALVTYGAGGLNMVNPVGLAYAEESPLLVISGSPETRFRKGKPHHKKKEGKSKNDDKQERRSNGRAVDARCVGEDSGRAFYGSGRNASTNSRHSNGNGHVAMEHLQDDAFDRSPAATRPTESPEKDSPGSLSPGSLENHPINSEKVAQKLSPKAKKNKSGRSSHRKRTDVGP